MFSLTIKTNNAAFEDHPWQEVARLLDDVAYSLRAGMEEADIHDVNGNTVGRFVLNDE